MYIFAFLNLTGYINTNVDQINADETSEIQGKVEINLTDENLKQSSSEV